MDKLRRGSRVGVSRNAVPACALEVDALVIFANLNDPKVGIYHQVMFDVGTDGVIFKHVLDAEVIYCSGQL